MNPIAFVRWLGLAFAALIGSLIVVAPASAQTNNRIKCESWNYQPARCGVPGIIDAQISSVIAGNCQRGNWGSDRNGVWVNNGCRAYFMVTTGGNGSNWGGSGGSWGGNNNGSNWGGGQVVRCESWQFQPARCGMDTRGGVNLQRVVAGDCRPGNWGFDRNGVWVINGCRADFVSGNGGNNGGGWGNNNNSGQTIECSSWQYQPARCNVRIQNSAQIDRVLGGECVLNRSWGWDRNGIWVNNGCRARFRVF